MPAIRRAQLAGGHRTEALTIMKRDAPEMFAATPPATLYPAQVPMALQAGTGLVRTGSVAQGQALIRAALATIEQKSINAAETDTSWWDVVAYALLDDNDAAIAAIERGVASGEVLDLPELESDPLLANLRTDSRFAPAVAPLRVRAQQQIAAAKAAGLL